LAVSTAWQGRGLDADLLFAAAERALLVSAQAAASLLRSRRNMSGPPGGTNVFGATPLLGDPLKPILPLATIAAAPKQVAGRQRVRPASAKPAPAGQVFDIKP
jgi:hypothetical protein